VKLGASLGVGDEGLRSACATARAAESLGFAGLWTSETRHDAFLPLAIAANATERIELGTSIAAAFSRSPMVVAQAAWDSFQTEGDRRDTLGQLAAL
jgi:alkanesulfonate monooxygenase SsuD/methylene tetrahydromethanopterin reductase-like flavin-dependent oxidoreductase (luciferase family)